MQEIKKIYERYGFELKVEEKEFLIFRIRQGPYYAVDIVELSPKASWTSIKKDYEASGYATRILEYNREKTIENTLFEDFFDIDIVNHRLQKAYEMYTTKRQSSFGCDYVYFPCPYTLMNGKKCKNSIIEEILDKFENEKPQLILIEAAAGFGKTSTSYELLRHFISKEKPVNPVFAELSRNRQAKIFRYVLLDEIDRLYPKLKLDLVEHEIATGKIPLIIDGFDELLQHAALNSEDEESFDAVESMLDTIKDLLKESARIVLTSRRTAIFSGDKFHEWLQEKSSTFDITRIKLEKPNIIDWIGKERYDLLKNQNVPLHNLSNPVLLSYIRQISEAEFVEKCSDIDSLVSSFFSSLLEREQERQGLKISVDDQLNIFINLARDMVEFDITSEDKHFIQELLYHNNYSFLQSIRMHYEPSTRPSVEELIETLSNHALLDRIGTKEESIGFVNQFIFGYLIGLAAISNSSDDWLVDSFAKEEYVSIASSSFSILGNSNRSKLFNNVLLVEYGISDYSKFLIDLELTDQYMHRSSGVIVESLNIEDCSFDYCCCIDSFLFSSCHFKNVHFLRSVVKHVNFLNCCFENCSFTNDYNKDIYDCWFTECDDYGSSFILDFKKCKTVYDRAENSSENDMPKKLLEQFWPKGKAYASTKIRLRTLYAGFDLKKKKLVPDALEQLTKMELLYVEGTHVCLNLKKINNIQKILGRES